MYEAFRHSTSSSLKPETLVEGPFDSEVEWSAINKRYNVLIDNSEALNMG